MINFIFTIILFLVLTSSSAWSGSYNAGVVDASGGVSFPLGIDFTNTPNWDPAVAAVHSTTGIESGCKVTVNAGDNTLIDIGSPCIYHIGGPEFTLTNMTAIDPGFELNENSRFIGVTMSGYTSQTQVWTAAQQETIMPIGRLNTELGISGPGSPVHLVRDDRYPVAKRDYLDRLWMEQVVGAQYVKGGEIFTNATSALILGQYSGILFNAQKERHVLAEFSNMSAIFLHHTSNGDLVGEKKSLIVDNIQYDTGTGLADLTSQQWTNISVLKSPKGANGAQEGGWFYVYGGEYLTQAAAEAAPFDFAEFVHQGRSGIAPLATIIIKKEATVLDTDYFIIDKRPCLICRP